VEDHPRRNESSESTGAGEDCLTLNWGRTSPPPIHQLLFARYDD
jgi:hypothetical protein